MLLNFFFFFYKYIYITAALVFLCGWIYPVNTICQWFKDICVFLIFRTHTFGYISKHFLNLVNWIPKYLDIWTDFVFQLPNFVWDILAKLQRHTNVSCLYWHFANSELSRGTIWLWFCLEIWCVCMNVDSWKIKLTNNLYSHFVLFLDVISLKRKIVMSYNFVSLFICSIHLS